MKLLLFNFIFFISISLQAFNLSQPSSYELKVDKELAEGVNWKSYQFSDLFETRQIINIIEIDLTQSMVLPIKTSGCAKLSNFANDNKAIAAINGTFFNGECDSRNFLKIDGKTFSKNIIRKAGSVALLIDKKGFASMKRIGAKEDPQSAKHGIGGFPQLVKSSKVNILPIENTDFFNSRHPRTAVALEGKSKVIFFAVDGRSLQSEGLSLYELAEFIKAYGAKDAMNLDGGGSTTMWSYEKGVINSPSDFFGQREITDGLAVF